MNILDGLWKSRHEKDVLFLELIEGYQVKVADEYPDDVFYVKDDRVLINYELSSKSVWINTYLIWSVFKTKFGLNFEQTKDLMYVMLEVHLDLEIEFVMKDTIPYNEEILIPKLMLYDKTTVLRFNQMFLDVIDGYEVKVIKDNPYEIFFIKKDKILLKYYKNDVWINKELIWSLYEKDITPKKIKELMKDMLYVHLKLEVSDNIFYYPFNKYTENKLRLSYILPTLWNYL